MKVTTSAGDVIELGPIETAPTIGIVDYSRRVTDDYGVTTVVERAFSRRMSVRLAVPFDDTGALQRQLATLRATPATWTADDRFASLSVRGFYKEFEVDHAVPPLSYCTLTVEGLVETAPIADAGGDPAVAGTSTLRLLQPVKITNDQLVSSSVPETDAAEWSASTTYPLGARVMRAASHRVYESAIAGNVGDDPIAASGKWIDVGPTNRWAMFDQALGSLTSAANAITVTLTAAAIQAVALLDVTAATVRLQATGYDRTIAASAGATTFLDLPAGTTRVTVTIAGGSVSVGTLLAGKLVGLGVTEGSPTSGITDYSRKDVDDFGAVTIVERAWSKRMAAKSLITTASIDVVANRIAAVRAVPSLWIGLDGLDSLTVYGFFKEFSIEVGETTSKLSLSIEGLSTAGKIEPLGAQVNWPDIADPTGTKPADNADVTGEHTSKDTNAVGGRSAAEVTGGIDRAITGVADLIKTYGSTDSAAKSADAASAAATAAQTARDQSSVARDSATQARTAAGDFAGQADTARRLSENARTLADQANTAASAARDAAVQARDGAGTANVAAQGAQRAASENAEAARVSATGASGSASTASGQASIATQKADAAGQSAATSSAQADIATTKAGQASTSASRAATSESNAAGSANAASSSAQVTASVRDAAQALFEKQYPPTLDPIGRTAYYSFGAIAGPSAEWPQPYATQVPANGLTAEWTHRFNKPIEKVVGRRYRFTAWVYSYATNLFFFASTYDGPNAGSVNRWNGIKGTAITPVSQGWNKIVGEFVVDDGFQPFIWPSVNIQPQNGPNNGQYHITGIVLEDVTSEVAAQGYATASASSASTASAKADASSQSATAADTARAAAATASGQAEASRNQAAASASSASGSANSATSSAQVAASAKDAAQASEGKASGSASSSAQNASSASASKDAAAQSASASQTSAANAATSSGQAGTYRNEAAQSRTDAQGFSAQAASSAGVSSSSRDTSQAIVNQLRPATLAPIQRDAYMLTAPQVTISGPGNGWPQAYISATPANAFNYEVYVMFKRRLPRNAGKRYRVTAFGYSYATNVVFFLGLYGATGEESSTTTADKYFGTMATNTPKATGFFQLSGEFNVDDNTGSPFFDPRIVINTTDGKVNNGLVHTTGLIVEDITQEYAARQQATASATSASAASASKDAASQSASAAQTSATNAATSAGQALTYRNDASTSANTAAGSASSAAQQAGVAVSARNDTAALHDDTGALRNSAAGFANASSGSASLASSKADASAQSASAADASRAAAVTAKGQSEASRDQAAASASTASGSANSASSSANVSASARDVAIINTALSGQSTFEQGGLYWQDDWTGAPDARTDRANTSKSYRVENTRPVCTIAPNVRVHLCPKQAFPNTAGRTYRVEIVGYPTEAAGGQICLDMIGFNADYAGAGLNLTGEYGRPVQTPLTSYKLDYTCDGSRALLRPRLVCYDDRRGSFNVVSFTIEDVTSEKAAGNSATAASTSAASAAASNDQAGQKASAANQSATNAATSAGNASTSAGQAATSASTAAGSANSATSSANLAASAQSGAVGALQSLRPTSLAPDARSAWSYNGKIVGPDSNWPTPYLTQVDSGQQNFESYVRPNKPLPNVPGRTYRLTAYVFSYGTNVRFSLAGYDGPNEATINGFMGFAAGAEQSVTPQSTGFRKITGELTVSEANQACIWPSVVINCDGGPNNGAYHCGVLEIVDITSEKAAQGAANASASSASAAQASSTSAGQSASSATQSANTATTANGQAQQAASAAQGSAAAANASEASARTFSTIASSYSANSSNKNDKFAAWPDGAANPDSWSTWVAEGNYRTARQAGIGSQYAIQTLNDTQDAASGFVQSVPVYDGYWMIEATVRLDANVWVGAGVTLSGVPGLSLSFSTEVDSNQVIRADGQGITRSWSKMVKISGQTTLSLHGMHGWGGFGVGIAAKYLTWFRLSLRPANAQEIAAGRALDLANANTAAISQEASTRAAADSAAAITVQNLTARASGLEGRMTTTEGVAADAARKVSSAWSEKTASVPGATAALILRALNDNGVATSDVALVASQIALLNVANGKVIPALAVRDGNIYIANDLIGGAGRIVMKSATHMKVIGTGFGSSNQFVEWFGPVKNSLAECTEAQAISYQRTDGQEYRGGLVGEGQLRSQKTTFDTGLSQVAIGPFVTNGKQRFFVVSMSFQSSGTRTSSYQDSGAATASFILERLKSDGTWTSLGTGQLGGYRYESGNNGYASASEPATFTKSATGTIQITDTTGGTDPIQLRTRITAINTPGVTGTAPRADQVTQILQITSYEP